MKDKEKQYEKFIDRIISDDATRLDWILRKLIKMVDFDKFLLACSNVCVFRSNQHDPDSKAKDWWIKQAKIFHESYELHQKLKKKGMGYE